MRKITVNVTPNNKPEVTTTNSSSGTKRKSKSTSDLQPDAAEPEPEVKPKRNKQSDKRVFVTKREDSPQANSPVEKTKNDNHVTNKNGKRAKSPKFFVTLHEPDKKKENLKRKNSKGSKEMIINPRDSEDSDPESVNDVNHISAISAEKIKMQQEQNNQQLNNINNQE